MKNYLLALCLFLSLSAGAQDTIVRNSHWQVGFNPLSYMLIFPVKEEIRRYAPLLSGNEYGFNIVVMKNFKNTNLVPELRFSVGNVHQVATVTQLHLGSNWFFNQQKDKTGFYAGAFFKYWQYHNRLTKIDFENISPYITVGNKWIVNNYFIDIRLNQSIATYSWSSKENTKAGTSWSLSPWPDFIRILPMAALTIGILVK